MMDEKAYRHLVDETMARIDRAFEEADPDLVECTISQGALSLVFADGARAIVSPQPPVRQMWLAFRDRAWHFDWDSEGLRWLDDRGQGLDLDRLLEQIVLDAAGLKVSITG